MLPDWFKFVSTIAWLKTSVNLSDGEETTGARVEIRWNTRHGPPRGREKERRERESVVGPGSGAQSIDSELYPEIDARQGHGHFLRQPRRAAVENRGCEKSWSTGTCSVHFMRFEEAWIWEHTMLVKLCSKVKIQYSFCLPSGPWRRRLTRVLDAGWGPLM